MIIEKNSLINKNPDIVEILSNDPVKFRCKICGQIWYPEWSPSSTRTELPLECWQCPNECGQKQTNDEDEKEEEEKEPDNPLII
ncbi:hypothetical protein JW824_00720 [bacterium]|nr:hypothetical protein [bacterium]RQV98943.1 MAG: hypothetical protein EH221_01050 [bacterium]